MNFNSFALLALTKDIYKGGGDTKINEAIVDIIKLVGGVGGLILTLVIMIIAVVIMTGSIAPRNIGKVWMSLFSCIGGALLFYSAYFFAPALAGIVG